MDDLSVEFLVFILVLGVIDAIAIICFVWKPEKFYNSMSNTMIFIWTAMWGAALYFEQLESAKATTVFNHMFMSLIVSSYWVYQLVYTGHHTPQLILKVCVWFATFIVSCFEISLVFENMSHQEFIEVDRWFVIFYSILSIVENAISRSLEILALRDEAGKPQHVLDMEKLFKEFIMDYMITYRQSGDYYSSSSYIEDRPSSSSTAVRLSHSSGRLSSSSAGSRVSLSGVHQSSTIPYLVNFKSHYVSFERKAAELACNMDAVGRS